MEKKIIAVASENFPNGLRADSVDENKIRHAYKQKYSDEEIPAEFDLQSFIRKSAFAHEGKFYFISATSKSYVLKLADELLAAGNVMIFYETFYQRYCETFSELKIFSAEILKAILTTADKDFFTEKFSGEKFSGEKFFALNNRVSLKKLLKDILKRDTALSLEELQEKFPYVPTNELVKTLSDSKTFLLTSSGKYLLSDALQFDEQELFAMWEKLSKEVKNNGYANFNASIFPKSFAANPEVSENYFCETLFDKFFSDDFSRQGNFLTIKGKTFGLKALIRKFCLERDEIFIIELRNRAYEINPKIRSLTVPLKAVSEMMTRVSKNLFVKNERVHFDIDGIDAALNSFVKGKIISLQGIKNFATFPPVKNFTWNHYLLESFVRKFSRRFTFYTTEINNSATGAICPKEKVFEDYLKVQAAVIVQENIPLNSDAIDKFLISNNYRKNRIEKVTEEIIKLAREMKRD